MEDHRALFEIIERGRAQRVLCTLLAEILHRYAFFGVCTPCIGTSSCFQTLLLGIEIDGHFVNVVGREQRLSLSREFLLISGPVIAFVTRRTLV